MRASLQAIATACCLLAAIGLDAWSDGAAAQDSLLVGTWQGEDPATGEKGEIIITAQTLQFGTDEPQIPYTAEGSGGIYFIYIGGVGNPPATFIFRDADNATLAIPGGPTLPLTRAAARAESAPPAASTPQSAAAPGSDGSADGRSLMDEMAAVLVPYGVATRYEPLNQSLEALLSAGWKLDQAAGASGAFTLLLTKGSSNALCVLVPNDLGQASTALSDCRLLN